MSTTSTPTPNTPPGALTIVQRTARRWGVDTPRGTAVLRTSGIPRQIGWKGTRPGESNTGGRTHHWRHSVPGIAARLKQRKLGTALFTAGVGLLAVWALWDRIREVGFGNLSIKLTEATVEQQDIPLAAATVNQLQLVDTTAPREIANEVRNLPNDLMLAGKKLAGILLERSGDRVAVGFGVNLAAAPQLPDREGASLGGNLQPEAFAPLLAGSFARLLDLWRQSPPAMLAQAWLARAHPIGTRLTVHSSAEATITGAFDGIGPDGALRLLLPDGSLEVVRAGDIFIR